MVLLKQRMTANEDKSYSSYPSISKRQKEIFANLFPFAHQSRHFVDIYSLPSLAPGQRTSAQYLPLQIESVNEW